MAAQLNLGLDQDPVFTRETFIVSPANAEALQAVEAWPSWPGSALALVGPPGSGKSHLAAIWASRAGAIILSGGASDIASLEGRPVLLDDADRPGQDEILFHLINMAARPGGGLLLTARTAPAEWPVTLPDLRSRLKALTVAPVGELDDAVLRGVMDKLFRGRGIKPSDDLLDYLVRRIERSAIRAQEVVELLDAAATAEHRAVNRALASKVLNFGPEQGDLLQ